MKVSSIILIALFIVGCASLTRQQYIDHSIRFPAPPPASVQKVDKTLEIEFGQRVEERQRVVKTEKVLNSGSSTAKFLDDIAQQLFNVSMVFTLPFKANIDDEINAEFIIAPNKTLDETKNLASDTSGQVVTEKIDVSRTVTARIVAPNFKVSPEGDLRQALSLTEPTKWNWILTPTSEGAQTVQLRVVAHVMVDGERIERELETFKHELNIEVTPQQKITNFISEYLEFIVGTFVIPLVMWFFHLFKSRKKKNNWW